MARRPIQSEKSAASAGADTLPNRRLELRHVPLERLRPPDRAVRRHPERQRQALTASIRQRGFVVPVLTTRDGTLIDGALRLEIAQLLGLTSIPVVYVDDVGTDERRLLTIALNKLPELGGWDDKALAVELSELLKAVDLDFTVEAIGFGTAEVDVLLEVNLGLDAEQEPDPETPPVSDEAVSRPGDLWLIEGGHRILCGNARDPAAYQTLLGDELARVVVTDPPYNVPIGGHVSGLGRTRHREFVEASGEMTNAEFEDFLVQVLTAMAGACVDGAVIFTAMDWRHLSELSAAGAAARLSLLNLCIWAKTNAGMGSLYRSQHELFFVWKKGSAPHVNNVNLGAEGRYRTNLWTVAGQNSFGGGRDEELALHPTVKPVALVTEAVRDVSHHGEIVLDPFCGSGTALIAGERTGRRAYTMELDPLYVDVALHRYLRFRPETRIELAATGETFAEVEARRAAAGDFDVEPTRAEELV